MISRDPSVPPTVPSDHARPLRDPVFLSALLIYILMATRLAEGFTVWYDEAWRMTIAVRDATWMDFWRRWWFDGWPLPIASPLYLTLVRVIHGTWGWPISEWALRHLNVLVGGLTLGVAYRTAFTLSGNRTTARIAAFLLAANAYWGSFGAAIKEHDAVVLIILYWILRLADRARAEREFGSAEIGLPLLGILVSTITLPAYLFVAAVIVLSPMRRRFRAADLRFLLLTGLPLLAWCGALWFGLNGQEAVLGGMMPRFGIDPIPVWKDTSAGDWTIAGYHAQLAGILALEGHILLVPVAIAWMCTLLFAALGCLRDSHRPWTALALLLGPTLELWLFTRILGVSPPRYFLWASPLFAIGMAMILSTGHRPAFRAFLLVLIIVPLSTGWIAFTDRFPAKNRWDLAITNLGSKSFNRERDVVVHYAGLTFLPHDVFDPNCPKRVVYAPHVGLGSLILHPDFPVRCIETPREKFWTDTDLVRFTGGCVWSVQFDGVQTPLMERLSRNLFNGHCQVDTFPAEVLTWYRFSDASGDSIGIRAPVRPEPPRR